MHSLKLSIYVCCSFVSLFSAHAGEDELKHKSSSRYVCRMMTRHEQKMLELKIRDITPHEKIVNETIWARKEKTKSVFDHVNKPGFKQILSEQQEEQRYHHMMDNLGRLKKRGDIFYSPSSMESPLMFNYMHLENEDLEN